MPSQEATPKTGVVVVRTRTASGDTTVGCVFDAVSDVVNIDRESIGSAPEICGTIGSHFILGVASVESRLVMFLNVQGLVGSHAGSGPD
jgi:purine-binding chemotaxis protein CheW